MRSAPRFWALPLRSGHILQNRLVLAPMASGTADEMGKVTEETLAHYRRLQKSGVGLALIEYTYVHSSGKSEPRQLGAYTDDHIEGLKQLVKVFKKNSPTGTPNNSTQSSPKNSQRDPVIFLQLVHCGGKSDSQLTLGQMMGPSGISVPVKDKILETPRAMTLEDIQLWKTSFLEGARRAFAAGFDGIELHGAHGYGLSQFLSPLTNQRTDLYGVTLEGRSRLICEIIQEVRLAFPTLLISVRMPGQDFLPEGLSPDDCAFCATLFEKAGADVLSISSGIGGWRRPGERTGEGYLVNEAEFIKRSVQIPVIGVGGIESAQYVDEALRNNKASLFAVGRKILSDPELFRIQVLESERVLESDAQVSEEEPLTVS